MACTLRVVVWMRKHKVNKISVVMDMREFKVVGVWIASCNWI